MLVSQTIPLADFDYAPTNGSGFPFIPDVVINLRCVDILRETLDQYGFLPFNVYKILLSEMKSIRSIYVVSEPKDYTKAWRKEGELLAYRKAQKYCESILHSLKDFLTNTFPHAVIGIRRGRPLESFQMLARSRYVICPPTTFCFWSGMINPNHVYYSPSRLFKNTTFVHSNFRWIKSPEVLKLSKPFLRNATVMDILTLLRADLKHEDVALSSD